MGETSFLVAERSVWLKANGLVMVGKRLLIITSEAPGVATRPVSAAVARIATNHFTEVGNGLLERHYLLGVHKAGSAKTDLYLVALSGAEEENRAACHCVNYLPIRPHVGPVHNDDHVIAERE